MPVVLALEFSRLADLHVHAALVRHLSGPGLLAEAQPQSIDIYVLVRTRGVAVVLVEHRDSGEQRRPILVLNTCVEISQNSSVSTVSSFEPGGNAVGKISRSEAR